MSAPLLELEDVRGGYGETQVLHGLDLAVREGEVHALLGRNGVGKSTTLKTAIGHLPLRGGAIRFAGAPVGDRPAHRRARDGMAFVPETRDVFGALTVRENLLLAGRLAGRSGGPRPQWTLERVVDTFPNLRERLENGGAQLSGGEQQMLAIGRALMGEPRILLLDEPTEGLAPIVIGQILERLRELKRTGLTVLLVEQNLSFALALADRVSVMSRGRIAWRGTPDALRADEGVHKRFIGV